MKTRISRPFAALILVVAAALAWWGWYEFIRSPYLTYGFITLELEFRLPAGAKLPATTLEFHAGVTDGSGSSEAYFRETGWHGHDGNRPVILAKTSIMYKTSSRMASLSLAVVPAQTWPLDLASDPSPTTGFSVWRTSISSTPTVDINFRLNSGN